MTKPRDPEALLSAYLADGMEVLPDRVVDSVLDEVHRTRQRAVFSPWRARSRSLLIAAALLIALALASVAAVGASRLLQPDPLSLEPRPSQQGVVAPSSTPSEPSAGPTASPVTSPTGKWIPTGSMGTPRSGFYYGTSFPVVRLLDGRVLVAGGQDAEGSALTSAELYDPSSGTWTPTGIMVRSAVRGSATLLRDGRVLVVDGLDADGATGVGMYEVGAELYDPSSGTWSSAGTLFTTEAWLAGTTATLLSDGKVLVAGQNGAKVYDPASGSWSATGKMIAPRHHHTATLLPDGTVLVAGGTNGNDGEVYSAELYHPDSGSWSSIADTPRHGAPCRAGCPRGGGMATLLLDGTLLYMRLGFAEIYDPATGSWTETGKMLYGGTSPTLLSDGTVLVVGGHRRPDDASYTAELYDPATGSWTETGNMLFGGSSATSLLDGTILVAGSGDAPSSAELYVPAGVVPPDAGPFPISSPIPTPSPTATPIPTPIPTLSPPQAGPIPASARAWTVTVVNDSSDPGTLFLAQEGDNGMGQLCGSVTPNVVAAGVTRKVTFLLPPKRVRDCWIWVNPPQGGSLFQTSDAPLAGKILFPGAGLVGSDSEEDAHGGGWVSP